MEAGKAVETAENSRGAMAMTEWPEGETLRARTVRGLAWKGGSQLVVQGLRILVAVVLARLLTPDEWGLAAMVLVFAALIFIFSDLAFGAALVQRRSLSEEDRSTVFWLTLAGGALFTVAGIGLSGPIAALYGEPEVKPLFAVLSLSFVVTALGTTQKALLTREMDFRRLEIRMMSATLAGAAVAILLAVLGLGAWAIIAQQIAVAAVSTVLLWASYPWRPQLLFSGGSVRKLGSFSANVLGTQLLFYVSRNADNFLIGRFLGSAPLGAYALAYNLVLIPFSRIASPIQEVLFPALSRLQDDPRAVASAWLRVNRLVAAVALPALLGLIVVAPDFVVVVLGERWRAAIPVVQILAWAGLLQSLQRLNSSVLQARDQTDKLFRFAILASVANVAAFAVGLQWGIVGVAAAYALTNTALQPFYTWLTARSVELPLRTVAGELSGVVQAAVLMAAVALGTRLLLVAEAVPPAARLVIVASTGIAVFAGACAWRAPEVVEEIRDIRRRRGSAPDGLTEAQTP